MIAGSRGEIFQKQLDDQLVKRGFTKIPYRFWDTDEDIKIKQLVRWSACKSIPRGNFKKVLQLEGATIPEEDEVRKAVQQCFREHLDVSDKIFKQVQEKLSANESDGRSPAMDKALRMLRHLDHDVLYFMLGDEQLFDFFYLRIIRVLGLTDI